MTRLDGAVYLTERGYVAAEDLTVEEVVSLSTTFRLRDAFYLGDEQFVALCCALKLEVIRIGGVLMGRVRRAA